MPDNSAMDTLKSLLGDNAEEKIQSVLSSLSLNDPNTSSENTDNLSAPGGASDKKGLESVMHIKGLIDELGSSGNDSRSKLLLSLKPFMRSTRQHSIDSAIRLLNLSKLASLFKF